MRVFEVGAREDGAGALHEGVQQGEFAVGQAHGGSPLAAGLVRGRVQGEQGAAEDGRGLAALAAQHGAHAGQQFADLEGLEDVVIGAGVQSGDAVVQASRAVTMSTGRVVGWLRMLRSTSRPSRPGRPRSSRTRS